MMQTSPAVTKRKRRLLQFSLRSLLIFTLLCAIGAAWFGRQMENKRREREAVDALTKLGATVAYDYQTSNLAAEPSGPAWTRQMLGDNFFNEVHSVQFGTMNWGSPAAHASITDAQLDTVRGIL